MTLSSASLSGPGRFGHKTPTLLCWALIANGLLLATVGCQTHSQRVAASRQRFFRGDYVASVESLEDQIEKKDTAENDVMRLDLASALFAGGRPAEAEEHLRAVRDRWDVLESKSLANSAKSYLTDDRRRDYSGADFERVMLRVYLTLADLCHDNSDALAYSLQINMKQQQLFAAARQRDVETTSDIYPPLAIGAYLHGVLREQTHRDYDAAARAYGNAAKWAPDFKFAAWDFERATHGVHSAKGNGVVYVFAFVGRGPQRVEVTQHPTSEALLIADRLLSAIGDHELPPTIAPVKVPEVQVRTPIVRAVRIAAADHDGIDTQVVCDVNQLAIRQYHADLPHITARAVVRRIVKKSSVYVAKDQWIGDNQWADIALTVAGVAWEASEAADTRSWSFLPAQIQVARVELPIGQRQITLQPLCHPGYRGTVPAPTTIDVDVLDGRNQYVVVQVPAETIVGTPLVR
jgi:uncharacterized protein